MKRGAERQLTKDDDEIEEIQDPQDFQRADEATLAKRQIRALPKRVSAASKPPAPNGLPPALASDADKVVSEARPPYSPPSQSPKETTGPLKFGGFTGFGAGTSASNPFTFTAQPSPVSIPVFNSSQSAPTLDPTPISPFLGVPKQSPLNPDTASPKSGTSPPTEETDAMALQYFKSLRGLNVSFLSAISTAVENDPFFDVASLAESYKNLRTTIQSKFDGSQPSRSPITTNTIPLLGSKAPSEKNISLFSLPKPCIGTTEASLKPSSASESGAKTGGFTFPSFVPPSTSTLAQPPVGLSPKLSESSTPSSTIPPESSKSAFKFPASGTPASTSSLLSTPSFAFAVSSFVESTTSKSTSGPSGQESEGSSAGSSSQPASTMPSFGSSSMPSFFATTKPASASATSDAASKPISVFGSSVFGSSSTTESNKSSPFSPSPDNKESKDTMTLFGSVTTSLSASTSLFGSPDKPVSFFGSASQPKTGAFTFGKPGGSIGNPVGFGFGSSSPSTGDGSSSSAFSFGAPSTKPGENLFSPPITDKSSESTPQPEAEGNEEGGEEDAGKPLPPQTHDEEGEGEEDEETTHVVKCKVYQLVKSGDKSEWKNLGIGMFRLKKHKETDIRRVLMRNSNTGRILLNFRIYPSLQPSLAKATVSFIGYENSTPISFRIRVKTEEHAVELKQAIEREIAAVLAAQ